MTLIRILKKETFILPLNLYLSNLNIEKIPKAIKEGAKRRILARVFAIINTLIKIKQRYYALNTLT